MLVKSKSHLLAVDKKINEYRKGCCRSLGSFGSKAEDLELNGFCHELGTGTAIANQH